MNLEGSASAFGITVGAGEQEQRSYKTYVSDDLIQQFGALLGTFQKDNQGKTGLLILVDEFGTIPDKSGLASIVKGCSSGIARFGVIGIATTVTGLMRGHTSIGRQIDSIRVPTMPQDELHEILKKVEYVVDHAITFEEDAADAITERSEGFPDFAHLLGKEAMILASRAEPQRCLCVTLKRSLETSPGADCRAFTRSFITTPLETYRSERFY